MVKEDGQLVCAISYEDPYSLFKLSIGSLFPEQKTLTNVTWKNPTTKDFNNITEFPIKYLPNTSSLFKDTGHPYRWFLGPYAYVYLVKCDKIDDYKSVKDRIQIWANSHKEAKRSTWMVIYVPQQTQTFNDVIRIYSKITHDFYQERPGDRSVCLYTKEVLDYYETHQLQTSKLTLQSVQWKEASQSYQDYISKLRQHISISVSARLKLYIDELQRLDQLNRISSNEVDFKQLYLMKESYAMLCQMVQLPADALKVYEELQSMIKFSSISTSLPPPPTLSSSSSATTTPIKNTSLIGVGVGNSSWPFVNSTAADSHTVSLVDGNSPSNDLWSNICMIGNNVLNYSINDMRTKVLKNKFNMLELQTYIFARQMYFLSVLDNHKIEYIEKGLKFVKWMNKKMMAQVVDFDNNSMSRNQDKDTTAARLIRSSTSSTSSISTQTPSKSNEVTESYLIYVNDSLITDPIIGKEIKKKLIAVWTISAGMKMMSIYLEYIRERAVSDNAVSSLFHPLEHVYDDDVRLPSSNIYNFSPMKISADVPRSVDSPDLRNDNTDTRFQSIDTAYTINSMNRLDYSNYGKTLSPIKMKSSSFQDAVNDALVPSPQIHVRGRKNDDSNPLDMHIFQKTSGDPHASKTVSHYETNPLRTKKELFPSTKPPAGPLISGSSSLLGKALTYIPTKYAENAVTDIHNILRSGISSVHTSPDRPLSDDVINSRRFTMDSVHITPVKLNEDKRELVREDSIIPLTDTKPQSLSTSSSTALQDSTQISFFNKSAVDVEHEELVRLITSFLSFLQKTLHNLETCISLSSKDSSISGSFINPHNTVCSHYQQIAQVLQVKGSLSVNILVDDSTHNNISLTQELSTNLALQYLGQYENDMIIEMLREQYLQRQKLQYSALLSSSSSSNGIHSSSSSSSSWKDIRTVNDFKLLNLDEIMRQFPKSLVNHVSYLWPAFTSQSSNTDNKMPPISAPSSSSPSSSDGQYSNSSYGIQHTYHDLGVYIRLYRLYAGILIEQKRWRSLLMIYTQLGDLYFIHQDYDLAMQFYEESIMIVNKSYHQHSPYPQSYQSHPYPYHNNTQLSRSHHEVLYDKDIQFKAKSVVEDSSDCNNATLISTISLLTSSSSSSSTDLSSMSPYQPSPSIIFKYHIYRKSLVCATVLNNRLKYLQCGLWLLQEDVLRFQTSYLQSYQKLSLSQIHNLSSNIVHEINTFTQDEKDGQYMKLSCELSQYYTYSLSITSSYLKMSQVRVPLDPSTPFMLSTISCYECVGGESHMLAVSFTCKLPEDIMPLTVQRVKLLFVYIQDASYTSPNRMVDNGKEDILECISETMVPVNLEQGIHTGDDMNGKTTIDKRCAYTFQVLFQPKQVGIYKLRTIKAYKGHIVFKHDFQEYTSHDEVSYIHVKSPPIPVLYDIQSPHYTPFHSLERLRVTIQTQHATDTLTQCRVTVLPPTTPIVSLPLVDEKSTDDFSLHSNPQSLNTHIRTSSFVPLSMSEYELKHIHGLKLGHCRWVTDTSLDISQMLEEGDQISSNNNGVNCAVSPLQEVLLNEDGNEYYENKGFDAGKTPACKEVSGMRVLVIGEQLTVDTTSDPASSTDMTTTATGSDEGKNIQVIYVPFTVRLMKDRSNTLFFHNGNDNDNDDDFEDDEDNIGYDHAQDLMNRCLVMQLSRFKSHKYYCLSQPQMTSSSNQHVMDGDEHHRMNNNGRQTYETQASTILTDEDHEEAYNAVKNYQYVLSNDGKYYPFICIQISGCVLRNNCQLAYSHTIPCRVTVGSGINIRSTVTQFDGAIFYQRFKMTNVSPIPMLLTGYTVQSKSNHMCITHHHQSPHSKDRAPSSHSKTDRSQYTIIDCSSHVPCLNSLSHHSTQQSFTTCTYNGTTTVNTSNSNHDNNRILILPSETYYMYYKIRLSSHHHSHHHQKDHIDERRYSHMTSGLNNIRSNVIYRFYWNKQENGIDANHHSYLHVHVPHTTGSIQSDTAAMNLTSLVHKVREKQLIDEMNQLLQELNAEQYQDDDSSSSLQQKSLPMPQPKIHLFSLSSMTSLPNLYDKCYEPIAFKLYVYSPSSSQSLRHHKTDFTTASSSHVSSDLLGETIPTIVNRNDSTVTSLLMVQVQYTLMSRIQDSSIISSPINSLSSPIRLLVSATSNADYICTGHTTTSILLDTSHENKISSHFVHFTYITSSSSSKQCLECYPPLEVIYWIMRETAVDGIASWKLCNPVTLQELIHDSTTSTTKSSISSSASSSTSMPKYIKKTVQIHPLTKTS